MNTNNEAQKNKQLVKFGEYLKNHLDKGISDFSIRANKGSDGLIDFYIRPTLFSGDTVDFVVSSEGDGAMVHNSALIERIILMADA